MNPFSHLLRPALTASIALTTLALPARAQQAQPTVINTQIRTSINEVGDGEMALTLRMDASEWANWKRQYGSNPSLFKRDMCKMFTQYELTDFELDQDDMNREAVVTIRGKALATYESGGVFEVELGKELAKGEIVDGEYRVTYTEAQGPNTISLIDQRVALPTGASGIEVTKNTYGEPVLRYELPPSASGFPWLWIGAAAALAGVGLLFGSTRVNRPQPRPISEAPPAESLAS